MAEMPPPGQQPGQPPAQPGQDSPVLRVVTAAGLIMYVNPTSDRVIDMLRKGEPPQGLTMTCLWILNVLQQEAKGKIPPQVVMEAAPAILALLAELATAAGVQLTPEHAEQAQQVVMQELQKVGQGGQPNVPHGTPPEQPQAAPPAQESQEEPGLIAGAMA